MQEDKKIIAGKENIENRIECQLKKKKELLREEIRGREENFLFMNLWIMNHIYGPTSFTKIGDAYTRCNLPFYKVLFCMKGILDTVLEYGISEIKIPTDKFEKIFDSSLEISIRYFEIASLYEKLKIIQSENIEKIAIENGKINDLKDPRLYEIFDKWAENSNIDPEWINWYFTNYPTDRQKAGKFLEKEFKEKYEMEIQDLIKIDSYFEQVSKQHIERSSTLATLKNPVKFLHIERKILLEYFPMDKDVGEKWIGVLEYKPWGDFRKSPLIPLKFNEKKIYTLMQWIFTPSNLFFDAWVTPFMLGNTKVAGKMRQSYGKCFQLFIDQKLKNANIKNLEALGGRLVKFSDFPEIRTNLTELNKQTEGFQVDMILTKEDLAFIVSCKARDFTFQRKIVGRNFFVPFSEINQIIIQGKEDLKEIYVEAECIAVNPKIREWIGLRKQKYIVPVLLTSRTEPLGVKDVKEYFLNDEKIKKSLIITISEFINLLQESNYIDILNKIQYFRVALKSKESQARKP